MIGLNSSAVESESVTERRKRRLRHMFESLLNEVTQPKFFGKRTITISARDGVPELVELETKDQTKLT